MISSFASPVLIVAADAVQELEDGGDALQGLWTLFTKCKSSLRNGHRLENATWRLWHREMSLSHCKSGRSSRDITPSASSSSSTNSCSAVPQLKPSYTYAEQNVGLLVPPTMLRTMPPSSRESDTAASQPGFVFSLSSSPISPCLSDPSPNSGSRPRSSSFSQVILGIIQSPSSSSPNVDDMVKSKSSFVPLSCQTTLHHFPPPSTPQRTSVKADMSTAITLSRSISLAPESTKQQPALVCSTLPTPAPDTPYDSHTSVVSVPAHTTAMLTIPAAIFPRVVVVNPTPDPSPHPTPPATPISAASAASTRLIGLSHVSTMLGAGTVLDRSDNSTDARNDVNETSAVVSRITPQSQDETSSSVGGEIGVLEPQASYFDPRTPSSVDLLRSKLSPLGPTSTASPFTASLTKFGQSKADMTRLTPPQPQRAPVQPSIPDRMSNGSKTGSTSAQPPPIKSSDNTLKPSDRRFFLQQSPDSADSSSNGNSSVVDGGRQETCTVSAAPELTRSTSMHAPSDVSSSVKSSDSHVRERPNSQMSHCRSNSHVQRRGPHGKIVVRAGGKAVRPQLMQHRSHSNHNFGAKLGMTSKNTPIIKSGSTSNVPRTSSTANVVEKVAQQSTKAPVSMMTVSKPNVNGSASDVRANNALANGALPSKGKGKAMFNIGSGSSTGSKGTSSQGFDNAPAKRDDRGPDSHAATNGSAVAPSQQSQQPLPSSATAQQPQISASVAEKRKRIVVASTSSEYETESDSGDEEDSWASEDDDATTESQNGRGHSHRRTSNNSHRTPTALERQALKVQETALKAALEAQRQRDMFTKVPQRSYSGILEKNRNASGLLSQLMKPDPNIFPPGHPYHSTSRNGIASTQDLPTAKFSNPLQTSKSAAALPVAANVQVEIGNITTGTRKPGNDAPSKGYRPKGRPQELEMEDDSESDASPHDKITMSTSMAQQKLAELAGKRSNASLNRAQQQQQQPQEQPRHQVQVTESLSRNPNRHSAPIPLGHPYNLPPPAAPSTPRTTRRLMLQTEMSESLRRNLLWERQVSKMNIIGVRRTSTGSSQHSAAAAPPLRRHASGGMIGDSLKPLTQATGVGSIVQLVPKNLANKPLQPLSPMAELPDERVRNKNKLKAARNRSWAVTDDFHTKGW